MLKLKAKMDRIVHLIITKPDRIRNLSTIMVGRLIIKKYLHVTPMKKEEAHLWRKPFYNPLTTIF